MNTRVLVLLVFLVTLSTAHSREENIFTRTFDKLLRVPLLHTTKTSASVKEEWIEQRLDNFNETDQRTWSMRFLHNDEHFRSGGPIFIYVGGEWTISPDMLTESHFYDMAKENHAYMFYTEHRYYGLSKPTPDMSVPNLEFLSVRQSLADLANFIRTQKANNPALSDAKVVLAGCSYSANMVTWFKRLYPELAIGAWASSGPVFAKVNNIEYKEHSGYAIRTVGGDACYNRIQRGIAELEQLFATNRGAEVKAMLMLCNNFDESSDLDLWTLFGTISDAFSAVVQSHRDGYIQTICRIIMEGDDDAAGIIRFLMFFDNDNQCADMSYKAYLDSFQYLDYDGSIIRQYIYQTCKEFGWYQTSHSPHQPFGTKFPLVYYTTVCNHLYGDQFTNATIHANIEATNALFGGLDPGVQNVYFSHGSLDPWIQLSIADERATVIPMHAHCPDLDSISEDDAPELRQSKERIAQLVREWLNSTT